MKLAIVGHRGTGKTSLLKRLVDRKIFKGPFLDLDKEMEVITGRTVEELFQKSEKDFRQLELDIFKKILNLHDSFIVSVGGGFPVHEIPSDVKVLWLRRETDKDGRIFLDRPPLNPGLHPLQDYEERRQFREEAFLKRSDLTYTMPEGIQLAAKSLQDVEQKILSFQPFTVGGIKTLTARDLNRNQLALPDYFELRDDFLTVDEVKSFFQKIPVNKIIYSARLSAEIPSYVLQSGSLIDVDVKLLKNVGVDSKRLIVSSHEDDINAALDQLSEITDAAYLKLCPNVNSWKDLVKGHEWQQEQPERRSFLPRSDTSRWSWYRLLQKNRQKLNFWREDTGSAADQPTLFNWLTTPVSFTHFAAVLGSPVRHSYSPTFHADFFTRYQMPFWSIDIVDNEWEIAFETLSWLGLKMAAVTAPLKISANEFSTERTEVSEELKSANTLILDDEKGWIAHNTDYQGFVTFLESQNVDGPHVAWGGSGIISVLKKIIPEISSYSSRQGKPREGESAIVGPQTVIWGAPTHSDTKFPPFSWTPTWVIDLNYKENSLARFYANQCKAKYISGIEFFRYQALEQQKFWSNYL